MVSQVEMVSQELIKPSHPTPQSLKHHKLSLIDQVAWNCFLPLIFFYQNDQPFSNIDYAQRSQCLKQSLSNVLTKFYPLAGRINGNSSVDCNDSGALYIEARVHAQLSEAIQNVALEELNQYLPFEAYPSGENVTKRDIGLALKISFFDCGGTAIGVCISHKIADLLTFVTFLNAWTATCRGETDILQPNFDLGYHHFSPMDNVPAHDFVSEEKIVTKRFVFDKEKLAALKEEASLASEVKNPSRVEAVTAFIWKQFIDVGRAKSDTKTRFAAAQGVNLRPRMSTPLPSSAMGNIWTLTIAFSEKAKDYHDLLGPLRSATAKIDKDYIKELQNGETYLSNLNEEALSKPEVARSSFTSWCRVPFYKMDFGWGKPLSVCTAILPAKNRVFMMDTRSGDGLEAWISMAEDEMAMLSSEFLALESNDLSK